MDIPHSAATQMPLFLITTAKLSLKGALSWTCPAGALFSFIKTSQSSIIITAAAAANLKAASVDSNSAAVPLPCAMATLVEASAMPIMAVALAGVNHEPIILGVAVLTKVAEQPSITIDMYIVKKPPPTSLRQIPAVVIIMLTVRTFTPYLSASMPDKKPRLSPLPEGRWLCLKTGSY